MTKRKQSEQLKQSRDTAASKEYWNGDSGVVSCPALNSDWIEVELVIDDNEPVPDKFCTIIDAYGVPHTLKTDVDGLIRLESIPSGLCTVSFSRLEADGWALCTEPEDDEDELKWYP